MLNRRILRIKAFKVLYSSVLAGNMSLAEAEAQLELSCEATRDLYIYMLGIVSPLTKIAQERIEAGKSKFNPTEEERNPNMKFAENALAKFLDEDVDFQKVFKKKKFEWMQYDLFLKKVMTSVASKEYYAEYMASDDKSLAEDCKLFTRIFEEEFVDSEELEKILEDKLKEEDINIIWNTTVEEILGDPLVSHIKLLNKDGTESEIDVNGIFISIGDIALNELALSLNVDVDSEGNIITDKEQKTNIDRVYAAGDVTGGVRQWIVASGEGAVAALSAYKDLLNADLI